MTTNQTVLVTGATGFVGSYLVRWLLQKGYKVRAIKRPTSNMQLLGAAHESVEWFDADICDVLALDQSFEGIDFVCHCAALPSFHPKYAAEMEKVNVEGTANVVNLCLHHKVKKLVHVSSIAALGRIPERLRLDESSDWVQSRDNSLYATTKHLAELEVWRGVAEGLSAVMVLPSVVVGSRTWEDGMSGFFKKVDQGLKFCPTGQSGFVDVRDVAIFIERMLSGPAESERFILNAVNLKHREFFGLIAQSLGVAPPGIMVGPFLAEVAWRVEWLKEKILGVPPLATRESARASVTHYYYSNEKSLGVPGFTYRSFEQTILEMAEQYKEAKDAGYPARVLSF